MTTLVRLVASVNASDQYPDLILLPIFAILGLVTVITAGRVVRQALSAAVQLIEAAVAAGLLSIMVLAAMSAAIWLLLAT